MRFPITICLVAVLSATFSASQTMMPVKHQLFQMFAVISQNGTTAQAGSPVQVLQSPVQLMQSPVQMMQAPVQMMQASVQAMQCPIRTMQPQCQTPMYTVRPQQICQEIISVPTMQKYIQTTHVPVVENIHYEAVPINDFELNRCVATPPVMPCSYRQMALSPCSRCL